MVNYTCLVLTKSSLRVAGLPVMIVMWVSPVPGLMMHNPSIGSGYPDHCVADMSVLTSHYTGYASLRRVRYLLHTELSLLTRDGCFHPIDNQNQNGPEFPHQKAEAALPGTRSWPTLHIWYEPCLELTWTITCYPPWQTVTIGMGSLSTTISLPPPFLCQKNRAKTKVCIG